MKKRIGAIALCLTLLFSFSFSAFAAQDGDADDHQVTGHVTAHGTQAFVTVDLAEETDVVFGKVTVSFDADVFDVESIAVGAALASGEESEILISDVNTEKDGVISIAWATTVPNTEGGTLLTVLLDADTIADVNSLITVTVDELSDNYAHDYEPEEGDDHFDLSAVNKAYLEYTVESALTLEEENYTEETWADFAAALSAAQEVLANEDATQAEVDEAWQALWDAMFALEAAPAAEPEPEPTPEPEPEPEPEPTPEVVDKTVLQALYDRGLELSEEDYTEESWAVFAAAMGDAAAVLADEDATQDDVDDAAIALMDAVFNLTEAVFETPEEPSEEEPGEGDDSEEPGEPGEGGGSDETGEPTADETGVDKSDLQQVYDATSDYNAEDYTAESWSDMEAAMARAAAVLADEDATQDDVDQALAALLAAIVGLEDAVTEGSEAADTSETAGAGTGDYSYALIVSAAALVALAALAVVAIRRRRA